MTVPLTMIGKNFLDISSRATVLQLLLFCASALFLLLFMQMHSSDLLFSLLQIYTFLLLVQMHSSKLLFLAVQMHLKVVTFRTAYSIELVF